MGVVAAGEGGAGTGVGAKKPPTAAEEAAVRAAAARWSAATKRATRLEWLKSDFIFGQLNEPLLVGLHAVLFAKAVPADGMTGLKPRARKMRVLMREGARQTGGVPLLAQPPATTWATGSEIATRDQLVWYPQRGPNGERMQLMRRAASFMSRCGPPVLLFSFWDAKDVPPPHAFPGVYVFVDTEYTLTPNAKREHMWKWPLLYLGARRDDNRHADFPSIHVPYLVQHFAERTCARGIPCTARDLSIPYQDRWTRYTGGGAPDGTGEAAETMSNGSGSGSGSESESPLRVEGSSTMEEAAANGAAAALAAWQKRPYLVAYMSHQCYGHRDAFFDRLAALADRYPELGEVHALGRCHGSNSSRASARASTRFDYLQAGAKAGAEAEAVSKGKEGVYGKEDEEAPLHYLDESVVLYSKYKFVIAFENHMVDGYITEKIAGAFLAGAVPLFWGDVPLARKIFRPETFIAVRTGGNANEENDENDEEGSVAPAEAVAHVHRAVTNSTVAAQFFARPPLSAESLDAFFGLYQGGSGVGGNQGKQGASVLSKRVCKAVRKIFRARHADGGKINVKKIDWKDMK